jgi:hypothetical protein
MKRIVYYLSFTLLGAMFGFFLHAMIEVLYIKMLLADFGTYGMGLSWSDWEMIHMVGVIVLVAGFSYWGFERGQHFWKVLYVDQKYSKWIGKLKRDF